MPKSTKICPKSIQKSFQNRRKCGPNRSTRLSETVLGASWGASGGAWRPRRLQDGFKTPKVKVLTPSWGACWGPKSTKIGSKSDLKCDQFFDRFEDRFLERFGANLAPSKVPQNLPKMKPSWLQNRCKLGC